MANEPKLRILLIDADSAYLAKLFDTLSPKYEVCVLHDAQEALRQFSYIMPDLVVLEMDLPEFDGVQFVRRLRREEASRTTPFVFLMHKAEPADIRLGYMVHAVRCLSKKTPLGRIATELAAVIYEMGLRPRCKSVPIEDIYERQRQLVHQEFLTKKKSIAVPVSLEPAQRETKISLPKTPPVHRLRVLIADSCCSRISSIETSLNTFSDCIRSLSGLETLEKAERYQPDLFVLGIRLQHLPGFQVSQALRCHPIFQKAPILGAVEPTDPIDRGLLQRYGFSRIFEVPDQMEHLALEAAKLAYDENFICHVYSLTYSEVLAEEERQRLKEERLKGDAETKRRLEPFRDFFRNIPKNE